MASGRVKLSEISVVLIFITGGMNFALGLGWSSFASVLYTKHYCYSWFIGVILGAMIVAPFILRTRVRYILCLSASLVLLTGILTISLPLDYAVIIATRYINGFAIGCCTVAFLSSTSELSMRQHRGFWLSAEQHSIACGILIVIIIQFNWNFLIIMPINQAYGIAYTVLSLLALVATLFYTESPIFHLHNNDIPAAQEIMQDIVGTAPNSNVVLSNALHDAQQYVDYNKEISLCDVSEYWPALIKMILFRSLVALTFSLPLNQNVMLEGFISLGTRNVLVAIMYAGLRFLATSCGLLFIFDSVNRHIISMCSLVLMSTSTLIMGIFFSNASNYIYIGSTYSSVICGLACVFQLCSGFYTPLSSIYLSEAFPMPIKSYLIAVCVIIEQLISIIIILTYLNTYQSFAVFCYVVCGIFLVSYVFFGFTIPDTRKIPLVQAQQRFNNGLYKIRVPNRE